MLKTLFKSRSKANTPELTPAQVNQRLQTENDVYLIDVRTPQEFATGHVARARLLPLQTLAQRLDEVPRDQTVVCICQSGRRSRAACEMLLEAGFDNVVNMRGGMMAWQMGGLPTGV